jgi:glycosyltransferase involved in cell wall biosynthesis
MQDTNLVATSFCIAIASHISNIKRVQYLQECLRSLAAQSVPIFIYLSISFASQDIREYTLNCLYMDASIIAPEYLNIRIRDQKTSQMRHYWLLYLEIAKKHDWIMFCDDDDTYHPHRTSRIIQTIHEAHCQINMINISREQSVQPFLLAGLYENVSQTDHRTQRHEYWCYCICMGMLGRFFEVVEPSPGILDDRCCDVLLAEYLRRKSPEWVYVKIQDPLYNYRVDENADSVTGFIQTNQHKYTIQTSPPPIGDDAWLNYVLHWNDFLHENLHIFLHDTYLRTLVGCELDAILRTEFKHNYAILDYVDQKHVNLIIELYNRVRMVCGQLYDLGL